MSVVDILIPLYNGSNFLDELLSSITDQTYSNWIVHIGVNGYPLGSTLYQQISQKYVSSPKIKIYDFGILHGRKSEACNLLLVKCTGDYFCLVDVDDMWNSNKLKLQIEVLTHGEYHLVGTACQYFGERFDFPAIPTGDISNFDFFSVNPIINSSFMAKRSVFVEKCIKWNVQNTIGLEDYEMWLECRYKHRLKIYNIDDVLTYHRIHRSSSFNGSNHNYVPEFLQQQRVKLIAN